MKDMEPVLFAGVGGAGMGPLAVYLSRSGRTVWGFDDHLSQDVGLLLLRNGVRLVDRSCELGGVGRVVHSSALAFDDPFLVRAKNRGILCERRGRFLAQLAEGRRLIAVVGSHGKTTTTAFLVRLLLANEFSVDYILGGYFSDDLSPAQFQGSQWLVAEVDESDGTIEDFSPEITVFLNLDLDHESFHGSLENLRQTFLRLFWRTRRAVVMAAQEARNFQKAKNGRPFDLPEPLKTPLPKTPPNLHLCHADGTIMGPSSLELADWSAATSVGRLLLPDLNCKFLPANVFRRQQILLKHSDILIMADYAHHPTELAAFLESHCKSGDLVIFQPHRYSRTVHHRRDFLAVLSKVENLILMPTYGAFEPYDLAGAAEGLAKDLGRFGRRVPCLDGEDLWHRLARTFEDGWRRFLFIGAGDIMAVAQRFAREIQRRSFRNAMVGAGLSHILEENVDLRRRTTFRIGGRCDFLIRPENLRQMAATLKILVRQKMPFFVLGHGSNVLLDDEGFSGAVLSLSADRWKIFRRRGSHFLCGAGLSLGQLCREFERLSIPGFEFLGGIPGTLGGAVRGNAGAEGAAIGDFVQSIIGCDGSGRIVQVRDIKFAYRTSNVPKDLTVLFVELRPPSSPTELEEIRQRRAEYGRRRRGRQPPQPSAGSIFRNPDGHSAWQLIDRAGLRGMRIGGAQISPIHCNFIVNGGGAKSSDVIALIFLIKRRVRECFAIDLHTEIEYIGNHWRGRL